MAVYFVRCPATQLTKVGFSDNPPKRLFALQTNCPSQLEVIAIIPGQLSLESKLHSRFRDKRLHGEWFNLSMSDIIGCLPPKEAKKLTSPDRLMPVSATEMARQWSRGKQKVSSAYRRLLVKQAIPALLLAGFTTAETAAIVGLTDRSVRRFREREARRRGRLEAFGKDRGSRAAKADPA